MAVSERTLRARIAAGKRWAHEPDRTKATAAARRGLEAKFEREVDPDGVLPPHERAKRVKSLKAAYYAELALRRRRPTTKAAGDSGRARARWPPPERTGHHNQDRARPRTTGQTEGAASAPRKARRPIEGKRT